MGFITEMRSEADAYVGGRCTVECVRDALREEAEHLDQVGRHSRAQHFFDAVEALEMGS